MKWGRIWEELREEKHHQNILYEDILLFKKYKREETRKNYIVESTSVVVTNVSFRIICTYERSQGSRFLTVWLYIHCITF